MMDVFPSDLSAGHLQRTWLYWVLMLVLLAELLWMSPRISRYVRGAQITRRKDPGPWGKATPPPRSVTGALIVQLAISAGTLVCLALGSAAAFYVASLDLLSALTRFAAEIPYARGSAAIGEAIGGFLGASLQVFLVLGAVASVDPTSSFPLRLHSHLIESTPNDP